jgi:hypothetical protein
MQVTDTWRNIKSKRDEELQFAGIAPFFTVQISGLDPDHFGKSHPDSDLHPPSW